MPAPFERHYLHRCTCRCSSDPALPRALACIPQWGAECQRPGPKTSVAPAAVRKLSALPAAHLAPRRHSTVPR